jgi:hypothetical protein
MGGRKEELIDRTVISSGSCKSIMGNATAKVHRPKIKSPFKNILACMPPITAPPRTIVEQPMKITERKSS